MAKIKFWYPENCPYKLCKNYICQKLHLLMLLLSARACSKTANRNSVFSEMPFIGSLSLLETIQLICISSRLVGFPVIRPFGERYSEWSAEVSPDFWMGFFSLGTSFLQRQKLRSCVFWQEFLQWGIGWGFWVLRGVISEQILGLFFFVVFEIAIGR